ncbi:MAG: XRE family transcriptional regulator [Odoribacter splanchnicus]|nr:XRE family transcriptional regulator [Odoribacter splanchnicus]
MNNRITKEKYEFAQNRIEELLPLVHDDTPVNDPKAVELALMSDVVIAYEKEHYPIEKPTLADILELAIEEKGIGKSELARQIGVSPSRVSDYLSGRSLPTLPIAALISRVLNISPEAILSAC